MSSLAAGAPLTQSTFADFVERLRHDCVGEMRVYADAHTYGWEYNAIKQALLDGRLQLVPDVAENIPTHPCIMQLDKLGDL